MSDNTHPQFRRSDGVSARGVIVTVLVVVAVLIGLVMIGSTSGTDTVAPSADLSAPPPPPSE